MPLSPSPSSKRRGRGPGGRDVARYRCGTVRRWRRFEVRRRSERPCPALRRFEVELLENFLGSIPENLDAAVQKMIRPGACS